MRNIIIRMKNIAIVFPNQLFEKKYLPYDPSHINHFIIVEDPIYFSDKERKLKFNLLKLIYQRASMKYYEKYLSKLKYKVTYLNWQESPKYWLNYVKKNFGNDITLHIIDPVDRLLESRIKQFSGSINIEMYETPAFLSNNQDLEDYVSGLKRGPRKFFQYNFYIWQRKRLDILLKDGKPVGGKYSYDKYNRQSIPGKNFDEFIDKEKIKLPEKTYNNKFYDEAIKYCQKIFKNYYSDNYVPENIHLYPITHIDAMNHFKLFLKYKLQYFGDYQDAIDFSNPYMFHSIISPQLNNGLVVPEWILGKVLQYYEKNKKKDKKLLYDTEGYIRQLNWREYSRLLYRYAYNQMIGNYFGNNRKMNTNWYTGDTGIEPIDLSIKQAFQYGYLHHIIRLMIMCNFVNLCAIHPFAVYKWFMEFSLDSYDWVMINNVYSMGLYADGGLTTTKPYISSSNYILSQTNIKSDGNWNEIWNTLYYYFIYRNGKKLTGRGKIYLSHWRKKSKKEQQEIIKNGKKYIKQLTN